MSIRSFLGGLIVGVAAVASLSGFAQEKPVIKGDSGRLEGVSVLKKGQTVCDEPWFHAASKIVSCE